MSDVFTKEKRSSIMKLIKSKQNKSTEIKLIHFFQENKVKGWRRNYKIFGKPDFVFTKQRIAVFADGCFWHGHNCRNTIPKQNKEYWKSKLLRKIERDKLVTKTLEQKKWTVIRLWECELITEKLIDIYRLL